MAYTKIALWPTGWETLAWQKGKARYALQ